MRCAACIVRSSGATNSAAYPARHIGTVTSNVLKTVRFIPTETPDFEFRPPNYTSGMQPASFFVAGSLAFRPPRKSMWPRGLAIIHPSHFSPTSVQLKGEINGAFPCRRHQKQHLEICITLLRTRMSRVRNPPGAPPQKQRRFGDLNNSGK